MMKALVVQPIYETAIMRVPRGWLVLPEEWREGVAYWQVVQAVLAQSKVIPYGPPTDIKYTFATQPDEIRAVELLHDCEDCTSAREQAAKLLEADKMETVCFVQFTQPYIYDAANIPTEFATTGSMHEAEVDFGD